MCRKLTLTGWVLLISEEFEQARVLVALLVSIMFLAFHFAVKPLKRTEDGALMLAIELSLVLVYICILLVKSCQMSRAVCATFGFGDTAKGLYLFFIFFGLVLLLVQIIIGAVTLYTTGYVPTIIQMAKTHSVAPSLILRRLALRKARYVRHQVSHILHLHTLLSVLRNGALVYHFRVSRRRVPRTNLPKELMPLACGTLADLYIRKIFPPMLCFVQIELDSVCIRWTYRHSVSLETVADVGIQSDEQSGGGSILGFFRSASVTLRKSEASSPRLPKRRISSFGTPVTAWLPEPFRAQQVSSSLTVSVLYSDHGGISRRLSLCMPDEVAHKWVCSLRALLRMLPRFASPAHWRWAQFCMAAARASDTSGLLSPADLPSLMKCANTSFPHYKQGRIAAEIQSSSSRRSSRRSIKRLSQALAEEATSLDFPAFCNAPHNRLAAWQVTGLLVEQSALSDEISYQFARFATNGKLQLAGWLRFVRAGQLTAHGDDGAAELDCEQRCCRCLSSKRGRRRRSWGRT